MNITINTTSFGKVSKKPLDLLTSEKINYALNPYKRQLTEEEVVDFSKDAEGIIAGTEPLNRNVLNNLPKLKVISRCGAGLDNIDLETAGQRGISVRSTPFGPTAAVAELAVGLILSLLRKTYYMNEQLKSGQWNKHMGNLLCGKRVGIVGLGRIGKQVGVLLKAFNVELSFNDVNSQETFKEIEYKSLKDLLAWADILCLHVPKSKDSSYLLDRNEFDLMKNGAWLINCSRGGIVNEAALFEALETGKLSGAAVDVFEEEPYRGPLTKLDNVILTPHIGSYAKEARVEMEIEAVNNLIKGLRGEI